jgi:putative Holliday junction resolvase
MTIAGMMAIMRHRNIDVLYDDEIRRRCRRGRLDLSSSSSFQWSSSSSSSLSSFTSISPIAAGLDDHDDGDDEEDMNAEGRNRCTESDDDAMTISRDPPPPPPPPSMPLRSLGVDYGLVRTGIAVTSGGYSPRPLSILSGHDNATTLSRSIVDVLINEGATEIVLGLPLHKNGTDSEQSTLTRIFGMVLAMEVRKRCGRYDARVVLYDERYTSKEARSRMVADIMSRNGRIPSKDELSGTLDADSACLILEQYYRDGGWMDAEVLTLLDGSDEAMMCDVEYEKYMRDRERDRLRMLDERDRRMNARREMINRARSTEGEGGSGEDEGDGMKKKRKKKKKR